MTHLRILLTAEEEVALARTIRDGSPAESDKARQRMIESNMGLVHKVVNSWHRPRTVDVEDLVQVGMIGLCRAVNSFDPEKGFRFSTYAVRAIRTALIREGEQFFSVRVPTGSRRKVRAGGKLADPHRHAQAIHAMTAVESLDRQTVGDEDEKLTFGGLLAGGNAEAEAMGRMARADFYARLEAALSGLSPVNRMIVERMYPMDGSRPMKQSEVAAELGVSPQAVSGRLRRVFAVLAESFEPQMLPAA